MNTNLDHSNANLRPELFFSFQPSPYLSPLFGCASSLQQNSQDQLNDFRLEVDGQFEFGGEPQHNLIDATLSDILFRPQQVILNHSLINEPEIAFKSQIQTPYFFPSSNKSKVHQIISFISSNDHLGEEDLLSIGKQFYQNSNQLQYVFKTLLAKFLKLRKTKEEMVKYCMRKAFKFIGDARKQKNGKNKKQKSDKKIQSDCIFAMPFKKNSSQKTMNAQYLKQVFSNQEFVSYYKQFLNSIQNIIEEDNNSKIVYLSQTIEKLLHTKNIGEVEKIKRLPWNRTILKKTQDLARTLIQFSNHSSQIHLNENENPRSQQDQQSN